MSKKCICAWCGKEYEKTSNRQVCCSRECQQNRNRELTAKRGMKHYYKHKVGNVNKKCITSLGSKGTSCTTKPKPTFKEEHRSLINEQKRIGLKVY